MRVRAKILTFVGALVGAFVGTLLVPGIGTAVGVIVGISVGWRFARPSQAAVTVADDKPPGQVM